MYAGAVMPKACCLVRRDGAVRAERYRILCSAGRAGNGLGKRITEKIRALSLDTTTSSSEEDTLQIPQHAWLPPPKP